MQLRNAFPTGLVPAVLLASALLPAQHLTDQKGGK